MPTFKQAHPWLAKAVQEAGGQVVRIGTKPWAHFKGEDAEERAQPVLKIYEQVHGFKGSGTRPWRPDQTFDFAIRLD